MSSIVIAGDVSGSVTLQAPSVAGSTTLTLPVGSGTIVSSGSTQTYTSPQRGSILVDNDLSYNMNESNNFSSTVLSTSTLIIINNVAGQSGYIILKNPNGYALSVSGTIKCSVSFLNTISLPGSYIVSYICDGTNTYCTASGALS